MVPICAEIFHEFASMRWNYADLPLCSEIRKKRGDYRHHPLYLKRINVIILRKTLKNKCFIKTLQSRNGFWIQKSLFSKISKSRGKNSIIKKSRMARFSPFFFFWELFLFFIEEYFCEFVFVFKSCIFLVLFFSAAGPQCDI